MRSRAFVDVIESIDYSLSRDNAISDIYSLLEIDVSLGVFNDEVLFPPIVSTPSFDSFMQENFAYVSGSGKIIDVSGSFDAGCLVIEGVREKRDGCLVIVFSHRSTRLAFMQNELHETDLPVGTYELVKGELYSLYAPCEGFCRIGGSVFECHWDSFVPMDMFDFRPDMEGVIVSVGGFQFKWKQSWTIDLLVKDARGTQVKLDDLWIEAGCIVPIGAIVEMRLDDNSFVRLRPDKTRGQRPYGLVNALPFSLFFETVPRFEGTPILRPEVAYCHHNSCSGIVAFMARYSKIPITVSQFSSLFSPTISFSSCSKCSTNVKHSSSVIKENMLDNNGRSIPRYLRTRAEVEAYLGHDESFKHYIKEISGKSMTLETFRASLGAIGARRGKSGKKQDFLMREIEGQTVVEFFGPRMKDERNIVRTTNDHTKLSELGQNVLFFGTLHFLCDRTIEEVFKKMHSGDRLLLKSNDAVFYQDIMKYNYIVDLYYSGVDKTYDVYCSSSDFYFRSKHHLDGVLCKYFILVKETSVGEDGLRVYRQVWIKRKQENKAKSEMIVENERGTNPGNIIIEANKQIIREYWPSATVVEADYWAKRMAQGAKVGDLPIPMNNSGPSIVAEDGAQYSHGYGNTFVHNFSFNYLPTMRNEFVKYDKIKEFFIPMYSEGEIQSGIVDCVRHGVAEKKMDGFKYVAFSRDRDNPYKNWGKVKLGYQSWGYFPDWPNFITSYVVKGEVRYKTK